MLIKVPSPLRRHSGGSRLLRGRTAPSAALALVSASYDPDGPEVYLTFDRAVDIAGADVTQFAIVDGPDGHLLSGFETAALVGPTEVRVLMVYVGSASGAEVLLTAGALNGIVAVDDGGAWAGVSGMVLPWP